MVELDKVLESFGKINGFKGARIIDSSGESLYQFQKEESRWEEVLLLYKDLAKHTQVISKLTNHSFCETYLEFEEANITFESLKDDKILIVIASKDANLGKVRLEIRKIKSLI